MPHVLFILMAFLYRNSMSKWWWTRVHARNIFLTVWALLLVSWTQTRMAYSICPEQRVILPTKMEAAGIGTREEKNRVRNGFSWIDSACCRGSHHDALYNHSNKQGIWYISRAFAILGQKIGCQRDAMGISDRIYSTYSGYIMTQSSQLILSRNLATFCMVFIRLLQ